MNQRIDELRSRLRDEPGSRLFFQLGDLLRKADQLDEAVKVLVAGLEHHPRYVAPWVTLGRIQLDQAQFSEAERSFARALELDPENSVAARMIGETAERVGEWVRAIKAYKLARALSPRDQDLEGRIEAIERRLAGGPDDISLQPSEPSFGDVVPADSEPEISSSRVIPPEPFDIEPAAPVDDEPFSLIHKKRPRVVVSMSEDDPFAVTPTGDSGVWMVADDVFAQPVMEYQHTGDDVFGGGSIAEVPVSEPDHHEDPVDERPLETIEESEFEVVDDSQVISPQEYSMPTVTLARLAMDQGDQPLAVETLQAILDKNPENREAEALLKELSEAPPSEYPQDSPAKPMVPQADVLAAKAEVLKNWMENIRAASDRRAP